MAQDYFETNDSDGELGDFIGLVEDSIWSNAEIESKGKADYDGADRYQLYWNVTPLQILQDDFDDDVDSATVTMGIGKDWYPEGDGDDIRHKDDPGDALVDARKAKPILFNGSLRKGSVYGKYLALTRGAVDCYENDRGEAEVLDGGDEVEYDLTPVRRKFKSQGVIDPRKASIWKGHVFRFRGLGLKYRDDQKPRLKALPVAYLGTLEEWEKNSGNTVVRNESGAVDRVGGTAEAIDVAKTLHPDTDPTIVETITDLVNNASSHTEFVKTALKLPEVKDDAVLTTVLMDEIHGPWSAKV